MSQKTCFTSIFLFFTAFEICYYGPGPSLPIPKSALDALIVRKESGIIWQYMLYITTHPNVLQGPVISSVEQVFVGGKARKRKFKKVVYSLIETINLIHPHFFRLSLISTAMKKTFKQLEFKMGQSKRADVSSSQNVLHGKIWRKEYRIIQWSRQTCLSQTSLSLSSLE